MRHIHIQVYKQLPKIYLRLKVEKKEANGNDVVDDNNDGNNDLDGIDSW